MEKRKEVRGVRYEAMNAMKAKEGRKMAIQKVKKNGQGRRQKWIGIQRGKVIIYIKRKETEQKKDRRQDEKGR